ncbi:hypothetical protein MUU45_001710 [Rodentibacter pneumotropicus]|uniref:Uncharacterized protein n=1 Tax=Rodentibacter pneumotropicus TaxID=758 RepID=A0AAW5LCE4_9PAST|nr:hypothetical protein [Rodentibacter pneumotropicus]MCQ9121223.1 hypothetical protein [Rodentibacter pneumotropicus]
MSEPIAKPVSTPRNAAIVGSLSALMPQFAKLIYPVGDATAADYIQRQVTQEFISAGLIFLVPFAVYIISLITSRYIATPEEMEEKRKLKRDLDELQNILDDIRDNPHRYSKEQINEFHKDYAETRKMLASIGRKALRSSTS